MFLLDTTKLQIGDIILIRTNDRTCVKIREFAKSNFSHALTYQGDYSCLESHATGVQSINIQRLIFQDSADCIVLRTIKSLDIIKLIEIINNAKKKVGTSYASRHELMKSYVETLETAQENNRQFCTRYIAHIYNEAGIPLVKNPDYCSPKDIEDSPNLEKVKYVLRNASEAEIEIALEKNPLPEKQSEITYYFFEKVRAITKSDIQNFIQLDEFLTINSSFCNEICTAFQDSKYTELGDMDKENNPWLYNYELFKDKFSFMDRLYTSIDQLGREELREKNYLFEANRYNELFSQTNCSYFKQHSECYKRQVELSLERKKVWLQTILEFKQ